MEILARTRDRTALAAVSPHAAQVVILGAGPAARGGDPSATTPVADRGRVLDWLLAAFGALPCAQVSFVGGYRAGTVRQAYPRIQFLVNEAWQRTGPLGSLGVAPALRAAGDDDLWVSYADVVYRPTLVDRMAAGTAPLILAVDSCWRSRYERRSARDLRAAEKVRLVGNRLEAVGVELDPAAASAEFAGLLRLSAEARRALGAALDDGQLSASAGLPEAIAWLVAHDFPAHAVDVRGDWAELDAPQDLARFILGSKAESLARLRPLVRHGVIDEQVSFILAEWRAESARVLAEVVQQLGDGALIVRSSATLEDGWQASQAGAYQSIPGVPGQDAVALAAAIDRVFASYPDEDPGHQVLVQRMLEPVVGSGVVLTRTAERGAPYTVINYDPTAGVTDAVTSGRTSTARTFYLHRGAPAPGLRGEGARPGGWGTEGLPEPVPAVLAAVAELESLIGHDSLDIEFAVTADGAVHILQVRPLAAAHGHDAVDEARLATCLEEARQVVRARQRPLPFVCGHSTLLSVMSDWNPAEIIGTKPRRLALSLYKTLITDEVWARQRAEYGYRDVRPAPLLVELAGHPYVDVRVTFSSFIPACLPQALADRLVDHALDTLRARPALHDKVEFEVLFTCYALDFETRARALRAAGFGADAIDALRAALVDLTRAGVARVARDSAPLATLEERRARIQAAGLPPLERAFLLVEDARRFGTLPFAHLARGAFVAQALLRSLVRAGTLEDAELSALLAAVRTVSGAFQEDLHALGAGARTLDELVAIYGHLRPGTYEITSPCYARAPEEFFRAPRATASPAPARTAALASGLAGVWKAATRRRVERALARSPLALELEPFLAFVQAAVSGREYGKFIFTRNLSAALESLAEFGAYHGLTRGDLSHVSWEELLGLRGAPAQPTAACLAAWSGTGREEHRLAQALVMPGFIAADRDLVCFEQRRAEPNFITQEKVRAPVLVLASPHDPALAAVREEVAGRIVLVPNADPGFDWLFGRGLAALVTLHGGVNSHMAIRAAEFRLPAAIGVGELVYDRLCAASLVELDCGSRRLEVVR